MVETGTSSGGGVEGTTGELQAGGIIVKDANSKAEMVRLIIQSLQHLGYGYESIDTTLRPSYIYLTFYIILYYIVLIVLRCVTCI